jgi:hypothetical protein
VFEEAQFTSVRHGSRYDEPVGIGCGYADEGSYSNYDFRDLHDGDLRGRLRGAHGPAADGPEPV